MRTSLNEIKAIEDQLFNYSPPDEALLFDVKLILNAPLRDKVSLQQAAYQTIRQYSRKQLKAELEIVHRNLLQKPTGFMQKLMRLFSR